MGLDHEEEATKEFNQPIPSETFLSEPITASGENGPHLVVCIRQVWVDAILQALAEDLIRSKQHLNSMRSNPL